jgi:hypothetical protein
MKTEFEKMRTELADNYLGDITFEPSKFSVCLEALSESNAGIMAFEMLLQNVNDEKEDLTIETVCFNSNLAIKLLQAVRDYVESTISDEEVEDALNG